MNWPASKDDDEELLMFLPNMIALCGRLRRTAGAAHEKLLLPVLASMPSCRLIFIPDMLRHRAG